MKGHPAVVVGVGFFFLVLFCFVLFCFGLVFVWGCVCVGVCGGVCVWGVCVCVCVLNPTIWVAHPILHM